MYIGAWQEYRLANTFTQPSLQRHAQLTEFYGKWQQLCNEQGEQAATKALIFDPLFASVAQPADPQQPSPSHSCYHLEQQPSIPGAKGQPKKQWRLDRGGAGRRRGVKSAGANRKARARGQQFVRQGVRTVQKRKENYMQSFRESTGSRVSMSAQASSNASLVGGGGARRVYPERPGNKEHVPPHPHPTYPTMDVSYTTKTIGITSEKVLTANPNRYVGARTTATTVAPPIIAYENSAATPVRSSSCLDPQTTPSMLHQTPANLQQQQQQSQLLRQQQPYYPHHTREQRPEIHDPITHCTNRIEQPQSQQVHPPQELYQQQPSYPPPSQPQRQPSQHPSQPSQPPQSPQPQRTVPRSQSPFLTTSNQSPLRESTQPRTPGSPNSGIRPRSTHSVTSLGSPHVWEQEVDDLLKWTEGLENGNDPLEQSWSEGMIVASPEK